MKQIKVIFLVAILAVIIYSWPIVSYARELDVTFGSTAYSKQLGEQFPIGVWVNSDETIGDYRIEFTYNPNVLQYEWGASEWDAGRLVIAGHSDDNEVGVFIYFTATNPGNSDLSFQNASFGEMAEEDNITVMEPVWVRVEGEGVDVNEEITEEQFDDEPTVENADEVNEGLNPVESEDVIEIEEVYNSPEPDEQPENDEDIEVIRDNNNLVSIVITTSSSGNIRRVAVNKETLEEHPVFEKYIDEDKYLYFTPFAVSEWPDGLTAEKVSQEGVFCFMDEDKNLTFMKYENGEHVSWDLNIHNDSNKHTDMNIIIIMLVMASLLMAVAGYMFIWRYVVFRREYYKEQENSKKNEQNEEVFEDEEL